jgi:two-component system nitrogen regulation sensor histidine kinase GlnL
LGKSSFDRLQAFDLLVTMVAVVDRDGNVIFANTALEDAVRLSRRSIQSKPLRQRFVDADALQGAPDGARGKPTPTSREPSHSKFAAIPKNFCN